MMPLSNTFYKDPFSHTFIHLRVQETMKLRHQPAHQGQLVLETPNMTRLFPCMVSCTITVLLKDNLIINSE